MRACILLFAAVLLSGCSFNKVHLSKSSSDETIRSKLFTHTPLGSSGTNVLKFAIENFPHKDIDAYYQYVDGLQATEGHRLPVVRTAGNKMIHVNLGSYPVGPYLFSRYVIVRWDFDEENVLTNIVVERHTIGL
jgi:hypothetical protein